MLAKEGARTEVQFDRGHAAADGNGGPLQRGRDRRARIVPPLEAQIDVALRRLAGFLQSALAGEAAADRDGGGARTSQPRGQQQAGGTQGRLLAASVVQVHSKP